MKDGRPRLGARRRPSLLAQFTLLSALLTAAIAIALTLGIQRQLERNALRQVAELAAYQVAAILAPNLRAADLSEELDPARYAQIDRLIRQDILRGQIVRVKIWSRDAHLIYSDEAGLVGQRFPVTGELGEALAGVVSMNVSDLEKAEHQSEAGYTRLLEVYVPLRLPGSARVEGAYEIYHDVAVLEPGLDEMRRFVWMSVGLGFLTVYASLFTLVYRASRELVKRSEENERRAAELAALAAIGRRLTESLDLPTVLAGLLDEAAGIVPGHALAIMLFDAERGDLRIEAARGYPEAIWRNFHLPLGQGVTGRVAATRRPVFINDTANVPDYLGLAGMPRSGAEMVVPLVFRDRLIGVINVESRHPGAFDPHHLRLLTAIADSAATAIANARLFQDLTASYDHTLDALAAALDTRDKETEGHSRRVVACTLALARTMGVPDDDLLTLRRGALLHDIGKIGVPDAILRKPGPLTDDERAIMGCHPAWGQRILSGIQFLEGAAEIVCTHQERWDGEGYPRGLKGEAIPLGARIFAVADAFDAITSDRPYRAARPYAVARGEIRAGRGSQFDPRVVDAFLQVPAIEWTRLRAEVREPAAAHWTESRDLADTVTVEAGSSPGSPSPRLHPDGPTRAGRLAAPTLGAAGDARVS